MKFLFVGTAQELADHSFDDVVAELSDRGHTVLRSETLDGARVEAADAQLVVHLDPSPDEDGLTWLREIPGHLVASLSTDFRTLSLATALIVRSSRSAALLSVRSHRLAEVVPPSSPLRLDQTKKADATPRATSRIRVLTFVRSATSGRLIETAYAISMVEGHTERIVWNLVGQPEDLLVIVEVCESIGVVIEVTTQFSNIESLVTSSDLLIASASTGEDPLTDDMVRALSLGAAVVLSEDETDLPTGTYVAVRSTGLQEDLVTTFRGVLDSTIDVAVVGRAAAQYSASAFARGARADALLAIAARSLRKLRAEIDGLFPDLVGWGGTADQSPATVYSNDFRIIQ